MKFNLKNGDWSDYIIFGVIVFLATYFSVSPTSKLDNLSMPTISTEPGPSASPQLASIVATTNSDENVEVAPTYDDKSICSNEKEIVTFKEPVPITWTAKLTGCLSSCRGAHFTRLPKGVGYKYPRFAAYYPDASGRYDWDDQFNVGEGTIPDEFLRDDVVLKIYGEWTMIDADHPNTVFGGKCVPMVDIKRIEILPQ